jgi:hypothetical protein
MCAFDKNYYANKKQELISQNQKKTQRFLADTMDFVDEIKSIDQSFQEISRLEQEELAKAQKPQDPITEGIKETVKNAKKELKVLDKK